MYEATFKVPISNIYNIKSALEGLLRGSGFVLLEKSRLFPDGHLELIAVDKDRTSMLRYKDDPRASYKKEAQRAGLELNAFPARQGFYLYLTVRPYMELMDAPEVPGITSDEIEQKTDQLLCEDVFNAFLPKLAKSLGMKLLTRTGPQDQPKKAEKEDAVAWDSDFVITQKPKGKAGGAIYTAKQEELLSDMERMRALGEKEKEMRSDQFFKAFILDLGESLDSLGRASKDQSLTEQQAEGMSLIMKQFLAMLKKYEVRMIRPKPGTEFDPSRHDAIRAMPAKGMPSGAVLEVVNTGFEYKGAVIKPAQVVTVK